MFFDADNATPAQLGAATVGATGTWSDAFWYNAGTATTANGDGEIATYIFTAADTAYFQGNKGTLTAAAEQIITLNGINDSTGMTLSGGSLLLSGAGANITVNGSVMTTISSVITGIDGLIKAGTGDLKLAAANTYTGVTLINGGQVIVDDAAALGLSTVTVATGGTLNLGGKVITNLVTVSGGTLTGGNLDVGLLSASTGIVSATLSGTAGLTKNTTGSLRLDGLNTFQGNVLVSQGTLIAGHVSALGAGAVTVSGGTLDLGTTTGLANIVTLTGGTLTGGELAADKLVPVAGTVATKLTGSGKLTKTAAGIVTLSGSNDFSGGADISGGRIIAGSGTALGGGTVSLTGGVLDLGSQTLTNAIVVEGGELTGGSFDVANLTAKSGTISALLVGSTALTKSATGVLTLSAANTFAGGVTLSNGTIVVGDAAALGSGAVNVNGGTLNLNATAIANTVTVAGGTLTGGSIDAAKVVATSGEVAAVLTGSAGLSKTTSGDVLLSGANTFTGGATVDAGKVTLGNAAALGGAANAVTVGANGTLDVNGQSVAVANLAGSGVVTNASLTAATVTLSGVATTSTFAGVLSGNLGVTKVGSGAQTLSGANT
ncbi:MAG: hypothetical protein EBS87_11830, partial [Sphingomonadaceae bacterium]|nr:hypothetical protein [Sphingomonadaceae bacterium]